MSSSKMQCGPCEYEYISKDAQKWCTNCGEGFCKDCEKVHRSTKISRDHNLIGIDDYKKISHISIRQTCEEHGKVFDLYCKSHDSVLCLACVPSQHKHCDDIIPLQDAAQSARTSTASADLDEAISVVLQNVQSIIQHTNLTDLDEQENKIKKEIGEIRTNINNCLDKMEQRIILELGSKLAKYRSRCNAVLKHVKESETLLKRLKEHTMEMKQFASDLQVFLGTRQINKSVQELLKSTSEYNVAERYSINVDINPILNSLLTEVNTFGDIDIAVTTTDIAMSQPKVSQAQTLVTMPAVTSVTEVVVKLKHRFLARTGGLNTSGCTILPNGQLIVADYFGKQQLLQYNQDGTHVRDIPVSNKPYDVTAIDSEHVAVSYGVPFITEVLNINTMTVDIRVDLDNNTKGLSYQAGKLYVVVGRRRIVVLNLSGEILNTFNFKVDRMRCVATTTDRIYYSDKDANRVTCCDMNGKEIWKFRDNSVKHPNGLAVDKNENVFVVGCESHNLTVISSDGKTSKTLLSRSDGLYKPRVIYFCKDTMDLLVCNKDDEEAFLFKVIS